MVRLGCSAKHVLQGSIRGVAVKRLFAVVAFTGLVLSGCDTGPAEGAGGTIVEPGASAGSPSAPSGNAAQAPAESAVGTRSNPAPFGSVAKIGDWEVKIVDINKDAADIVTAENMFNDAPAEGRSFVIWSIEATYTGSESGIAWIDLSWKLVGAAGNSFGSGIDDMCGVIPDDLFGKDETFSGGVVAGNVCVSAETSQVEGGTILVEELFGGSRTFFAIP
jgi:hypothetical protein